MTELFGIDEPKAQRKKDNDGGGTGHLLCLNTKKSSLKEEFWRGDKGGTKPEDCVK